VLQVMVRSAPFAPVVFLAEPHQCYGDVNAMYA
jgi:hypothetical protein